MPKHFLNISLNFLAVVLLITLIAAPFYFAKNFSQVAGVKSQSPYLVVPQVDKFPSMTLTQNGNNFQITFTKQNPSQAYLSVLIINNPTNQPKTYELQATKGSQTVFFGESLESPLTKINVPAQASVPISILSSASTSTQTVEFAIHSN